MNRKYRKTVIAANWKMNTLPSQVKPYVDNLKQILPRPKWCEVILCVPYTHITATVKACRESRFSVAAQNVSEFKKGAYTGEVSAAMLRDLGVRYCIIGHSERRQYHGEDDMLINKKVLAAMEAGINPIICVGETLEQREKDLTMEQVALQVKTALAGVPAEKMRRVVIAYEPLWAIGTGVNATPEQANEVCNTIRAIIRGLYGARIARAVPIQYGGSVNEKNAESLFAQPDVDGGLVGGASLDPEKFAVIINAANQE
ncbi:MAG: triose-phosphate isomerase [Oscillospiraceae bacterium]|nr:triose-phosphate isomerase [Oscillospiraceae bacterium]